MAENSAIEWTDATWNPITGCTMVSAGCTNCYAMGLAGTRLRNHPSRAGLTRETGGRHVWTGEVRLNTEWLDQPLRWRRPRRIFVCAHGDLFHEAVPDEWIDLVFAVMAMAPQHTFQVLTKRPERMRTYLGSDATLGRFVRVMSKVADDMGLQLTTQHVNDGLPGLALANVWLGTSVEDQATADARIPHLLAVPAKVRFLSVEPMLGPVDLTRLPTDGLRPYPGRTDALRGLHWMNRSGGEEGPFVASYRINWVICGGESGAGARPMHPDWARSLRDQCQAAGVPFLFKQWGEWGTASYSMSDGIPVFRVFDSFQRWVHKAPTWVQPGAVCMDAAGRHCKIGADFMRARDEGTFPVTIMDRVGKKRAGRLLDGREWNQFPGGADA